MSIKKIKNDIIQLLNAPILPGGVKTYFNVCGKMNCQCKDPHNPKLHGPYTQLSYSISGKSSTVSIKKEEAAKAQKAVNNFRKLKSLVNELALTCAEGTRTSGVSSLEGTTSDSIKTVTDSKPENVKSCVLHQSRKTWKNKALKRHDDLEKNRIRIRDLENSRNKWREKALEDKKTIENLQAQLDKAEKKLVQTEARSSNKKKRQTLARS
jgi:hypothetical protein